MGQTRKFAFLSDLQKMANKIKTTFQPKGDYADGTIYTKSANTAKIVSYNVEEGANTTAKGKGSHAEGSNTSSIGDYSHVEGVNSTSSGHNSHAEGNGSNSIGQNSHAEGTRTIANNNQSHAEGYETKSMANGAHAEGDSTIAYGKYSHAEGANSVTGYDGIKPNNNNLELPSNINDDIGGYAHAEGSATLAISKAAHSEGCKTFASGEYSHAEGRQTIARGEASHTEGIHTIANETAQHASGMYNKTSANALFIIGNGTSDSNRSNAFEVSKTGDAIVSGEVVLKADANTTVSLTATLLQNLRNLYNNFSSRVLTAVNTYFPFLALTGRGYYDETLRYSIKHVDSQGNPIQNKNALLLDDNKIQMKSADGNKYVETSNADITLKARKYEAVNEDYRYLEAQLTAVKAKLRSQAHTIAQVDVNDQSDVGHDDGYRLSLGDGTIAIRNNYYNGGYPITSVKIIHPSVNLRGIFLEEDGNYQTKINDDIVKITGLDDLKLEGTQVLKLLCNGHEVLRADNSSFQILNHYFDENVGKAIIDATSDHNKFGCSGIPNILRMQDGTLFDTQLLRMVEGELVQNSDGSWWVDSAVFVDLCKDINNCGNYNIVLTYGNEKIPCTLSLGIVEQGSNSEGSWWNIKQTFTLHAGCSVFPEGTALTVVHSSDNISSVYPEVEDWKVIYPSMTYGAPSLIIKNDILYIRCEEGILKETDVPTLWCYGRHRDRYYENDYGHEPKSKHPAIITKGWRRPTYVYSNETLIEKGDIQTQQPVKYVKYYGYWVHLYLSKVSKSQATSWFLDSLDNIEKYDYYQIRFDSPKDEVINLGLSITEALYDAMSSYEGDALESQTLIDYMSELQAAVHVDINRPIKGDQAWNPMYKKMGIAVMRGGRQITDFMHVRIVKDDYDNIRLGRW